MEKIVPFAFGLAGWVMLGKCAVIGDFSYWGIYLFLGILGTWMFFEELIN